MEVEPLFDQVENHHYNAYEGIAAYFDGGCYHSCNLSLPSGDIIVEGEDDFSFFNDILDGGE